MDAVRTSDGRIVVLKQVNKSNCPWEEEINRMFTMSDLLASDPHNHVAPVYDVLQSPLDKDIIILVMPYFMRINGVRFSTVGEGVECMRQLFEGLQFLHRHNLAHCDIHINNLMMDPAPLFSESPHPVRPHRSYDFKRRVTQLTRTSHPTKYYYIDFGLSILCRPPDASPLIHVSFGGDKTVPEYEEPAVLRDPYKIDVYCLGNLLQNQFLGKSRYFDSLGPLLSEMTHRDPGERPSVDEAFARFKQLRGSLTQRALRSRVVYKGESGIPRFCRACRHLSRTLYWTATKTPALPTP
ncbi:kinase-like domain-containing protein, partial [Ganoderma leucocontextum]